MKKIFAGMALLGGLTLAAADPYFDATLKHVDSGGEMLSYNNISAPMKSFDNIIRDLGRVVPNDPDAQMVFPFLSKTLDLTSFKAFAQSSVQVEPKLYVYKSFVLIDANSKSILCGKALQNAPLDTIIKSLPADTRLALYSNINGAYIWQRLNEEIAASGSQKMVKGLEDLKAEAKKNGFDLDALAGSISGPVMLVVTGSTLADLKFAVVINDKDGVLSATLRKRCPTKPGESARAIKSLQPHLPKAQLVYGDGCIMVVSDPAILKKPAKMFGETPRYSKYAAHLPKEGSGFMVLNLSKKFTATLNSLIPQEYNVFRLKPVTVIAVDTVSPDGVGCVVVSNFSIPSSFTTVMETMIKNATSKQLAAPAK